MTAADWVWYDESGAGRIARALLAPASWAYAGVVAVRGTLYDRGVLPASTSAIPVLSLGNLTVGGTGKTPLAAWAAAALQRGGAHPAIVLRGYGDDEPLVHARLNPAVPVMVDADRVRGVAAAAAAGADCVVLDDAFQHRRIARRADWVLVAAERWRAGARLLPAGPLREPVAALARASVVVVTRKTASRDQADEIAAELSAKVPSGASAVVRLAPAALVDAVTGAVLPLAAIGGQRVVAVAAVATPDAFFAQLQSLGTEPLALPFRDHHRFSAGDVSHMQRLAQGRAGVVCTLKDAVKLAPLWRGADASLWYVSQATTIERGQASLDASLALILNSRARSL